MSTRRRSISLREIAMNSASENLPQGGPQAGPPDRAMAREALRQEIAALEAQLADLGARMPAHSIPPAMMLALDELEERLTAARAQLATLG